MTNTREVAHLTETLKQAKAQRLRRYEKRETQYSQNKMFKEDAKKFYRNLGMKKPKNLPLRQKQRLTGNNYGEKYSIMKEQTG